MFRHLAREFKLFTGAEFLEGSDFGVYVDAHFLKSQYVDKSCIFTTKRLDTIESAV